MSLTVQAASVAAWSDEAHVEQNRQAYRNKFEQVTPLVADALICERPEAGFYLWARTAGDDVEFTRELYARYNVLVLPGSFLGRVDQGVNPGAGWVRIALVDRIDACVEAAGRIARLTAAR